MPDFEYRQTVVMMKVPVPQQGTGAAADFRAVGRIPLVQGRKAAFGAAEPEPGREKEEETETEQALPQLVDGQSATLTDPRVQAKQTQPPPRYSEGTLVDAMQNAWRFVKDEALRERLKEAKGIGTPATRAEIIRASNARTFWLPTASWWCRRRPACSSSNCYAAPPPRWSIPGPRQSGRCGSTMSWWARRISAPSSTRSPARWTG